MSDTQSVHAYMRTYITPIIISMFKCLFYCLLCSSSVAKLVHSKGGAGFVKPGAPTRWSCDSFNLQVIDFPVQTPNWIHVLC